MQNCKIWKHVLQCWRVVVASNRSDMIGWTLNLESGWCVLWSEDAANFLFRAFELLGDHANIPE